MYLKTARSLAKPQQVAILDHLKRSLGMPVAELARRMKMSYMGVKQHCVEMEKHGLLDTWRVSDGNGRPEKWYRLTEKAMHFFPETGNELTLEILRSIQEIYGPQAPDKLLYAYFARRAEGYAKKLKGRSIVERITALAKLREAEGHCTEIEFDPSGGLRLVEYHCPLKEIAAAFPNVQRMEEQMISKLLQVAVERTEERASGLTKYVYFIPSLAALGDPKISSPTAA
jgi:predicted ArsR family transcriptional regulator